MRSNLVDMGGAGAKGLQWFEAEDGDKFSFGLFLLCVVNCELDILQVKSIGMTNAGIVGYTE